MERAKTGPSAACAVERRRAADERHRDRRPGLDPVILYCDSSALLKLFIDEVFMMKQMFHNITDTVGPLCEYLEHIFEQKVTFNIDSVNNNDLMLDLLHSVLFYPTLPDIFQTYDFCLNLTVVAMVRFFRELCDEQKSLITGSRESIKNTVQQI